MNNIKNGGYAFPHSTGEAAAKGMTLRDWFAGQALIGFTSNQAMTREMNNTAKERPHEVASDYATMCYTIADAMIAHREKETP